MTARDKILCPSMTSGVSRITNKQNYIDNLYTSEDQYNKMMNSQSKKVTKRFRKKKTPLQLIKDNILKNRHNKRVDQLRELTQQNIRLFFRLRKQKSSYNFTELHRQQSCNILPSQKSRVIIEQTEQMVKIPQRSYNRCMSAKTILRSRCDSIKRTLKGNNDNLTINDLNIQRCSQKDHFSSRIIVQSIKSKQLNENSQSKCRRLIVLPKGLEDKLIKKKLGFDSQLHSSNKSKQITIRPVLRHHSSRTYCSQPKKGLFMELNNNTQKV